ncbi:hypothetical protein DQ04_06261040 [Trypanosoma grayi]|uniref:hypothetical protein n=1 Tax=Trypanosoma grayi TaxID=71804 RepID=UPI0004F3FDC6|nr:hypothetical protein DQ04_06261040 [Trypanosoma grayi]KEG08880.1 hypothetical protein DQ04_06261040 [Trypanosoma grayi]
MAAPVELCYSVQLSAFTARRISAAVYPPPYFIRGKFDRTTFETDACLVPSNPSWSLCRRFECTVTGDMARPLMVVECYCSGGERFVGMCHMQLPHLLAATAGDGVGDPVVTQELHDGRHTSGELSFCAVVEEILPLTLRLSRVTLVPPPPAGTVVCVELSCGPERPSRATGVRSQLLLQALPFMQFRATSVVLSKNGIDGAFVDGAGVIQCLFHITVPTECVEALKAGSPACSFAFDEPVISVGPSTARRCVGDMIVSTDRPAPRAAVSVPGVVNNGKHNSDKTGAGTSAAGVPAALPHDLQALLTVFQMQELVTFQDRLAAVRKEKDDIQKKLQSERLEATSMVKALEKCRDLEVEILACTERQQQLGVQLSLLREKKKPPNE